MQNFKMICVSLSFLTTLFSNYRVASKVKLKGSMWRQNSTTFIRNTAILVLKEEWSLRWKNISEMNTPFLNSVVFLFFLHSMQGLWCFYDLLPTLLINKIVWEKMVFWAYIIHFAKRIILPWVIKVKNSECLFVRGSC